ncbi:threonine--tRNA ligase [Candidatus Uhrbacteria bacterium]|nr:threonine--tRNA ligase [Candidatus Uhrbacteria bacterium]MBD3284521.1 threonine--tRNA ligase [Candidatus Uhrbacteria bacterium]
MISKHMQSVETQRHSAAHLMAAAIQRLFPEAKFGVGPVIENGFYYDIDIGRTITEEDLKEISKQMKKLVSGNPTFEREELSMDEAIKLFEDLGQTYKVELLQDLKEKGTTSLSEEEQQDLGNVESVSIYKTGAFTDLCRGPHVEKASDIGPWKLTKFSGAYWRGDQNNPQMQRIYGVCFATQEELDDYLTMMDEAEKRDHRKLGAELDLFTFSPIVGSGLPMFTPRGTMMRDLLKDFVWELMKPYGYERVTIPHIAKCDLYKTSGHWDKFEDDLFHVSSKKTDDQFVLKPMNCPHHTQIYASKPRSYRDLPVRYSEVTMVYRDENTGQLQGLSRVRSITQDDAHVFCRKDQVAEEVMGMYRIIEGFYKAFDMPLEVHLSVRDPKAPEKYLGGDEVWKMAEGVLADVMKEVGIDAKPEEGEAAFYGPKLDFVAKDAIGRQWQLATIQVDFNLPERFELEYTNTEGEKERPVMIHRAILGSVERFLSILIEHYAGAFPAWLAPVQVQVVPVADRHNAFSDTLRDDLLAQGIRAEVDDATESVGKKIRKAELRKVPYMVVVGDKESSGEPLTVRVRGEVDQQSLEKQALIDLVQQAIADRS